MHCFCTLLIPIPCSCTPEAPQNPATPIPIPIFPSPSPYPHPIPISPHPHPHPRLQAALRRHLVAAGSACTPASPVPPPGTTSTPTGLGCRPACPPAGLAVRLAPPKTCSTGLRAPCALACAHQQLFFGEKLGKGEGENFFFVFF